MSSNTQTNGKKSSNSSVINTPASTPVTNGTSQTISQSTPPPLNNNAPKYGTLVPNRIFVGGITANTTEGELLQLFSSYGTVKAAKIIQDRAGVSKGYGFITFESEDDAKRPLKDADNIVLRERKLNIAPAIKKQPFSRAFEASSPSTLPSGNTPQYYFSPNAGVPFFQGGVTYYQQPSAAPGDPNSQPTTVYQAPPVYQAQTGPPQAPSYSTMMFPHHIYMPQQYPMPPMPYDYNYYPNNGGSQYMVSGGQNGPSNTSSSSGNQPPPHSLPPSNSPPRPPCYNSLPPPYTSDQSSIYYNMPPIYGTPLEGTSIYGPETLDMANGGGPTYSEVSAIIGDYIPAGYEYIDSDFIDHNTIMTDQQPPQQSLIHDPHDIDSNRQTTKTPVVSVLSIEQHQEKDPMSMQSGRRVKLQPQPPPPPPQQPTIVMPSYPQHPPNIFNYNFTPPQVRPQIPQYNKTVGNTWRKTRNYSSNRKTNNNDSSSLRTDSNSSASAVDENKNEEKTAPITSTAVNNFHLHNGTRSYQNSLNRRPKNPKEQQTDFHNRHKPNFAVQLPPVVVRNSTPSQGYMMPSSSPARRPKRSAPRRSMQQGGVGSLGEIGAGDAPLPDNDMAETCKKIETLKI